MIAIFMKANMLVKNNYLKKVLKLMMKHFSLKIWLD
jgi:hypothetical protein